jgi:anthranilate synthase component I
VKVSPPLAPGEVTPLVRSISATPDPLDIFNVLCAGGLKPDSLLLESGDTADRRSEKSLVVVNSALRISCRGREVVVRALNANGRSLLPWLERELSAVARVESSNETMTVRFDAARPSDEESRLLQPSPIDVIRKLMAGLRVVAASSAHGPLVAGIFSYDFLSVYESLPPPASNELDWPDFEFWLPERMIWIHHRQQSVSIVAHVFGGEFQEQSYHDAADAVAELSRFCANATSAGETARGANPIAAAVTEEMSDAEFRELVATLKLQIEAGTIFQIVPSRTFRTPCPDPLTSYRRLRRINPSPYMFFVNGSRGIVFGSSPETAVKVDGTPRRVEIRPIAGTRRRGFDGTGRIDVELDARLEADLRIDEKEIAEHMMLVDLARNDVARVSIPGTRKVDKLLTVERYSHVMHLVSHVSGVLRPELDALHAYVASMNMGTLVGAPKIKAAELLRAHEKSARGPYGGAVGYFTADGRMDTSIVIRSAVVREGVAHVRAGAGVVYDSDPAAEAAETKRKAAAVLRAIRETASA